MTASPPLLPTGTAVQLMTDCASALDVPETPVGAAGTVEGLKLADAVEAALLPALFRATTVTV